MKQLIKPILLLIPLLISIKYVDGQFVLSGEFRPRTEFSHGYKTLAAENQDWSVFTAQRTRLNALYSMEKLNTKLVLQDVRVWGSQPQLVANEDYATSVHEAWAEVFLAKNLSLKAGRQELVYDDQRIFGNVGWAHQARSHDIALLKYEDQIKFHAGIAHHEDADYAGNRYTGPDAYKDLQFGWFNKTWNNSSLSLMLLNNGVPALKNNEQVTRYSQTAGGRFSNRFENLSVATNLYYQTGKHFTGKEISAWNFLLEAALINKITVGYEYLSGNSYDKADKVYAFTPFYGTNHKFNGFMDYFYVGNHINSVGLHDAYVNAVFSTGKFIFKPAVHYFLSAGEIAAGAEKYLGTEVDLTFGYKIQNALSISAGWSTMFAGESLELLKGGSHETGNHWAYLMLSATPSFIHKQ